MSGQIRKAAAWLGLVADDRYNDPVDEEYTEQVFDEAEPSTVTPIRRDQSSVATETSGASQSRPSTAVVTTAAPGRSSTEVADRTPRSPMQSMSELSRIITVHPRNYNEARTIGEHFRDGVPVIMNLSELEDADAKRLVDFASGLIFGLHGNIERVTKGVFLLSPINVNVTAEDRERIASGGFFNQS